MGIVKVLKPKQMVGMVNRVRLLKMNIRVVRTSRGN
jgi:hypothetical protein